MPYTSDRIPASGGSAQTETEQEYRAVLRATDTTVFVYDVQSGSYRIDLLSEKLSQTAFSGQSLGDEMLRQDVLDQADVALMRENLIEIASGAREQAEHTARLTTRNGQKRWFRLRMVKVGECRGKILITATDIHDQVMATEALRSRAERDALTGLYNRESFFERAADMIASHGPGYYVMACFDIDNFKVINDQHGSRKGDEVLIRIADVFREGFEPQGGICCRVMADHYAILYPASFIDTEELARIRERAAETDGTIASISFSIGRYIVTDMTLAPSAMYDRAAIAEASVKGRYDVRIATYTESMREHLLDVQEIIGQMNAALENGHFKLYLQPQYNHTTGTLIGAEALVRWLHPEHGLIPPARFIPVFERNGFIYELDKYIWEQASRLLRRWLDEGRDPVPLSVNVSRYDVFREDFIPTLTGLLETYALPVDLLRLEITESAFARSAEQIIAVVKKLKDAGFVIEIDDFGSGYSSFNTLKDVPANVLKLDMRFLEDNGNSSRGGNILESIVRMAKWLGMPVIAEGVETRTQADYLKSIGCDCIQGYLYGAPMPVPAFEALTEKAVRDNTLPQLRTVDNLNNDVFWNPNSMETLIFNSFVGGACIFEYHNGGIELLRANDKYAQVIGSAGMTVADALRLNWTEHLDAETLARIGAALERSIVTGDEVSDEYLFLDLPGCPRETYLRSTLRVIASAGDRHLIYCMNENITAQREAEKKERDAEKKRNAASVQLQAIMENVNGGVTAVTLDGEAVTFIFANDTYYRQLGYTREQFAREVKEAFSLIHPDDRERVIRVTKKGSRDRKPYTVSYRAIRRDGRTVDLQSNISITQFPGQKHPVQISVANDITKEKEAERRILETAGQLRFLNETARDLLSADDSESAITDVLGKILKYFDGARAYVFELFPEQQMFSNTYEVCAPGITSEKENLQAIPYSAATFWLHAFDNGQYINICDVSALPESRAEEKRMLSEQGITSLVAVPLRRDGEEIGFLGVDDPGHRQMQIDDLKAIGDYLAVMLTRRDLNARILSDTEAMRRSNRLVDDSSSAVYVCDAETYELLYVNSKCAAMCGRTVEQAAGMPCYRFLKGRDKPCEPCYMETSTETAYTEREYSSQSTGRHYMTRGKFIEWGGRRALVEYLTDETERINARKGLMDLVDGIPGGIGIFNYTASGKLVLVYLNDGYYAMLGIPREKRQAFAGVSVIDAMHPDDYPILMQEAAETVRRKRIGGCSIRIQAGNGRYKWIRVQARVAYRTGSAHVLHATFTDIDPERKALLQLEASRRIMSLANKEGRLSLWRFDLDRKQIIHERAEDSLLGLPLLIENVPESQIASGVVAQADAEAFRNLYRELDGGAQRCEATVRMRRDEKDAYQWLHIVYTRLHDSYFEGRIAIGIASNVDLQQETLQRYEHEVQLRHEMVKDAVIYYEINLTTGIVEDYRSRFGGQGVLKASAAVGNAALQEELLRNVAREDRDTVRHRIFAEGLLQAYERGDTAYELVYRRYMPESGLRYLRATVTIMKRPSTNEIIAFLYSMDIDEEYKQRLQTQKQAETDGMTGLYNKLTAETRVRELLSGDSGRPCALMIADLDDLKAINDSMGHAGGDRALCLFADVLHAQFRQTDIIGRIGGDEFMVFLDGGGNRARLQATLSTLVQRIRATRLDEKTGRALSGSVGAAIGRIGADTYEELFRRADTALYQVKRHGKGSYAVYTPEMDAPSYRHKSPVETALLQTGYSDREDLEHLLHAVSTLYPLVIAGNLTRNRYYLKQYDRSTAQSRTRIGFLDELVAETAAAVHPDDRASYLAALSRESLLAAHKAGRESVVHEMRQRGDGGTYRRIRTEVVFIAGKGGDVLEITLSRACDPV